MPSAIEIDECIEIDSDRFIHPQDITLQHLSTYECVELIEKCARYTRIRYKIIVGC